LSLSIDALVFCPWRYCLQSNGADKRGEGNDIHESPVMNLAMCKQRRQFTLLLMRQPHRRFVIAITLLQVR
jgi:hypothetical protein